MRVKSIGLSILLLIGLLGIAQVTAGLTQNSTASSTNQYLPIVFKEADKPTVIPTAKASQTARANTPTQEPSLTSTSTRGPRMTSTRDLSTATATFTPSRTSTWSSSRVTSTPVAYTATAYRSPTPYRSPTRYTDNPWYTYGQDIYNCSDFATWSQANAVYQANRVDGDPNKLDSDGDGIPCESLPGAP